MRAGKAYRCPRCGQDGTGIAVIDDDYVLLLRPDGSIPRPFSSCSITIRDGDTVEVVGRAERRSCPGVDGAAGYRASGVPLVFDGRPDELLLVWGRRRETAS